MEQPEADMTSARYGSPEYGAGRLWLSWAVIVWERLWLALWPAAAVLGLFALMALSEILPLLPSWLHSLVLAATAAAFAVLIWRGFQTLVLPG